MIHHTIVNQFDPLLPRLGGKLFVLFHRSISWIHFVVIGDGIAMIRVCSHIVLYHRLRPNGREAHRFNIIQRLNNAADITTMTHTRCGSVDLILPHTRHHIVRRISIYKTIRRDQVNHIGSIKAFPRRGSCNPLFQRIVVRINLLTLFRKTDFHIAGLRSCTDRNINKKVIPTIGLMHFQ